MSIFAHRIPLRAAVILLSVLATAGIAAAQVSDGRLKRSGEATVVKITYRTDSKPFSFSNDQLEPAGYTIDLCRLIVKSLEQQIGTTLNIEWVPVTTRERFDAVAGGRADMECGSTTV